MEKSAHCPRFGTETLEMAETFWQGRTGWVESEDYLDIPDRFTRHSILQQKTGLINLEQQRLETNNRIDCFKPGRPVRLITCRQ